MVATARRFAWIILAGLLACSSNTGGTHSPSAPPESHGEPRPYPASAAVASSSMAEAEVEAEVEPPPEPPSPPAEELLTAELGGSPAAVKLLGLILDIKQTLKTTRYQHKTRVRRKTGHYAWDCSGMVAWMLGRAAPKTLRGFGKDRPLAIDFYDAISRAPTSKTRRGWRQLEHVSDARPGDLFAFPRSSVSSSPVTGHVGIFIEEPWEVAEIEGAWAARILDATRTPHQNDTRANDGIGGFGFGTMMFLTDESGKTIAYGWHGTNSRGYLPTHVVYGRLTN